MLINILLKQNYLVKHYEVIYSMFRIKEGIIILLLLHFTLLAVGLNSRLHCFCSWILFIGHCCNFFHINNNVNKLKKPMIKNNSLIQQFRSDILEYLGYENSENKKKQMSKSKPLFMK